MTALTVAIAVLASAVLTGLSGCGGPQASEAALTTFAAAPDASTSPGATPSAATVSASASPLDALTDGPPPLPAALAADKLGWRESLALSWQMLFDKPDDTRPAATPPVRPLLRRDLDAADDGSLWRLGHSTVLIKLDGRFWLTDPVFGERASPVGFAGPRRFHPMPITLDELPPLAAVILSHDHYDHLDKPSIQALAGRTALFVTPTGVGDLLVQWGVPATQVRQLPWWGQTTVDGVTLTATPAQHFSGRGLFDRNQRLWSGWAIRGATLNLFFSGDSGYFRGFKAIGARLGPFDLTLLEAGAYDRRWLGVHMLPEQTVQAHRDLRGRWLLPIHNGSFDLAFHRWDEPLERVMAAAAVQGVPVLTPAFGEVVALQAPAPTTAWWRALRPAPQTPAAAEAQAAADAATAPATRPTLAPTNAPLALRPRPGSI